MRRTMVLVVFTLLAAGFIPVAPAGAVVYRADVSFTSLWCDTSVSSRGTTLYFYGAGVSSSYGPWADIEYAAGRRDYRYSSGQATGTVTANADGTSTLAITQPLRDGNTGAAAGTAVVSAVLAPDGDLYPVSDQYHEPGYGYRETGTLQDLRLVSGSVVIDGTTFTLPTNGCEGVRGSISVWENSSSGAYVDRGEYRSMFCALQSRRLGTVWIDAYQSGGGSYIDVFVEPRRGFAYGYSTPTSFTDSGITATVEMQDDDGVVGAASVAGTFTVARSYTQQIISQGGSSTQEITEFSVAGSVALTVNGRSDTLDMSSCSASSVRYYDKFTSGKQGKGKAPANDAPAGAVLLAPGTSTSVKTGGAVAAPEAPCDGDDRWFGKTVWYRLQGTGGSVTIDTAGSDFDTVAGVYTGDGTTFTEVTCVDDADTDVGGYTYQSRVTVPTTNGITYWIQIGGYGGQFGTLRVAVR